MKRNEFENLLKSLADAWSRRDYNSAANFFDEEVHYGDPLRYSFSNRMQLQAFFEAEAQQSIHMKARIAIMVWF